MEKTEIKAPEKSVRNNIARNLANARIRGWPFLLAFGLTLIIVSILFVFLDVNPLFSFSTLVRGAFGSPLRIAETLVVTTPLLLTGLACAVAFRCQLWNIGAEGQLYLGAIFATLIGILVTGLPAYILLPVAIIAGVAGGGLWGLIPGFLKVRFKANEVMVTIMLNYVALLLANLVITGPLAHKVMPKTIAIQEAAWLPMLWQQARLHSGIILAAACSVTVYFILFHMALGYRIRATGLSINAARNAGIKVGRTMVSAFALSGAIAGLAGAIEVLGVHHSLVDNFSPGFGFTGIIVALLGRNHPGWIFLSAFIFAALLVGSQSMQIITNIPVSMVYVIQACLILIALGARAIRVN